MAGAEDKVAEQERRNALQQERRSLKKTERKAKRQEIVRGAQLKALKRVQKESGRAGKIAGGTMADVGAQTPIAIGRGALEAGEKILDVATSGAYTPIDVATTIGGSVFQKGAGKVAKYGIGRPVGKQVGKAPYRPAVAIQKRRVKAAKKKGKRARADRRAIDQELAQGSIPEKMGAVMVKGLVAITFQAIITPFEIALSVIMMILFPIVFLLLMYYLIIVVLPASAV